MHIKIPTRFHRFGASFSTIALLLVATLSANGAGVFSEKVGIKAPSLETLKRMAGAWAFRMQPHDFVYQVMELRLVNEKEGEFIDDDNLALSNASKESLKDSVLSKKILGEVLVVRDDDTYGGFETIRIDDNSEAVVRLISAEPHHLFDKPTNLNVFRIAMNENGMIEPIVPYHRN